MSEKLLQKSTVGKVYNQIADERLKKAVLNRFIELLSENDLSEKKTYPHQVKAIYPAIALYTILVDANGDKESALSEIEKAAFERAEINSLFFKRLSKLPFFFSLFGKMCKIGINGNFGEPGFKMIWENPTKDTIKWTCTSCYYKNEFSRYNVLELTKIFCEVDDILYGNLHGTKWARTKTIGNGDDICDFHFKNERYNK